MLDLYAILLSLHIMAVAVWIGGGIWNTFAIGHIRAARDGATLERFIKHTESIGAMFGVAALTLVATGFALMADGDWGFDLWIILALVAWLGSAVHGARVLGPGFGRVGEQLAAGTTLEALDGRITNLVLHARVELTILLLVIVDMVVKPGA